jgi:hypothetical protein
MLTLFSWADGRRPKMFWMPQQLRLSRQQQTLISHIYIVRVCSTSLLLLLLFFLFLDFFAETLYRRAPCSR